MRNARVWLLPVLTYALIAAFITWPLVLDPSGHVVGGARSDVWNSLWGLWFVAEQGSALPAVTSLLDHPGGGRIAVADPLNSLLALPLTALLGPVIAYAVLVLGHVTFGGLAAHALGRETGGSGWIAGVGYQLAPVCLAHLQNGSSEAISTGWLPLAALAVIRANRTGSWSWRIGAGIALGLCALGGWYAGVCAWLVVAAVVAVGGGKDGLRGRLFRLAPAMVLALAMALPAAHAVRAVALASDGLVDIKQGEDLARIRRTLGAADPRSFVMPGDFRSPDFAALEGNPSDFVHASYLGFSLIGLAIFATVRRRRRRETLGPDAPGLGLWWLAGGAAAVLALGPVLVWGGRPLALGARDIGLPMPYLALEPLPGFGSLSLLWRLSTGTALALAVIADRLSPWWATVVVAEVLAVSPAADLPQVTPLPQTAALAALDEADGAVVNLPPTAARSYLYEQVVHGHPVVGSLNTGTNVAGLSILRAARAIREGEEPPQHLEEIARSFGVRWVVWHRDVLMDDSVLEAAGTIRKVADVVAEDDRVRVIRLY